MVRLLVARALPEHSSLSGRELRTFAGYTRQALAEFAGGQHGSRVETGEPRRKQTVGADRSSGTHAVELKHEALNDKTVGKGKCGYVLLGGALCPTPKQNLIMTEVFGKLHQRDPAFFEKFERARDAEYACGGRKNRRALVARSNEALYANTKMKKKPKMDRQPSGWYIDTSRSATDKTKMLKLACTAASIEYGKDLVAVWD